MALVDRVLAGLERMLGGPHESPDAANTAFLRTLMADPFMARATEPLGDVPVLATMAGITYIRRPGEADFSYLAMRDHAIVAADESLPAVLEIMVDASSDTSAVRRVLAQTRCHGERAFTDSLSSVAGMHIRAGLDGSVRAVSVFASSPSPGGERSMSDVTEYAPPGEVHARFSPRTEERRSDGTGPLPRLP